MLFNFFGYFEEIFISLSANGEQIHKTNSPSSFSIITGLHPSKLIKLDYLVKLTKLDIFLYLRAKSVWIVGQGNIFCILKILRLIEQCNKTVQFDKLRLHNITSIANSLQFCRPSKGRSRFNVKLSTKMFRIVGPVSFCRQCSSKLWWTRVCRPTRTD